MKQGKLWIAAGLLAATSTVETVAASITWDAASPITDSGSDVLRVGGRWAAERMVGSAGTIQGVTFRARGGFTNILYSSGNTYAADFICPDPSTPDVNDDYRSMLRGLSWQPNAGIYDITLTNLTPGTTYKVQIWCSSADQKAIGAAITWMDSVNNGNLVTIHLQNGGDGNLGEFAVGTFTADETGVQHIYGSGSGADALLNGIQVRDMSLPDGTDDEDVIPDQPLPGPAGIEWEEPHNITDDTDISTEGTLFAAENVGNDNTPTINGVTFEGWKGSGRISYSSTLNYTGVGAQGVSEEYTTLLDAVSWDESGQYTISVSGLEPGEMYLVEIWFSSMLNTPSDENIFCVDSESGETNGVVVNSNLGEGLGQYCIGRFTAKSTNQVIGIEKKTVGNVGNPAFNAILVRQVEWMPDSPFQGWMATYGLTNATLGEDSDGDGAINLYEYALDGNPTNAADRGVDPVVKPTGDTVSYIYLRRKNDPGLSYSLRIRSDLIYADWSTNGFSVSEGAIDSVWSSVTNSVPLDANDTLFYDLKIEQQ